MKNDEFSPLPEEFAAQGPEFAQPAPEFEAKSPPSRKRSGKKKLYFAAAAALLLVLFSLDPDVRQPLVEEPAALSKPAPAAATPAPETEPIPESTPDPEPEPVLSPACEPVFICFSDELSARLLFTNPEAFLSVHAELWDTMEDNLEQTWDLSPADILSGEYELPDMPGLYEIFMRHHDSYDPNEPFPVPELRISMTFLDAGQETTDELVQPYTEELGWSVRDRGEELAFRTYESRDQTRILLSSDASEETLGALAAGDFLITVQLDDRMIAETEGRVDREEMTFTNSDNEEITYYYTSLTVPKNSGSSRAVFTVYQRLSGYDFIWSRTVELEY